MQSQTTEAAQLMADFEQAILVFGKIQQDHTLSLQQNHMADVGLWNDERARGMARLQQTLGAIWDCESLRDDARLGRSLQRRIGAVLEREQELAKHVKLCQSQLKGEMGKMRKGKKAMGGYGAIGGVKRSGLCFRNSL